jgi:outer membrane protein assembly factor BamD (BamD/ComL family)
MNRRYAICLCCLFAWLLALPLQGAKKKPFSSEEEANQYLLTHYNLGADYYSREEWRKASNEFEKVIYFFPTSDAATEASFYLGICYYEMKEYDFANAEFSSYLKTSSHPEFFEESIFYKYCIAKQLSEGFRRRPFKYRYFPKWIEGQSLALEIYDEVAMTVPNHELAVCSLFSKAALLQNMREYRESIDAYQTVIRRFPKHELTPESFLQISEVYYELSKLEFQNPDLLALAELNARKFGEEFPRDERVECAENYAQKIKEVYAMGLCSVGQFYERTHYPSSAAIYYQCAIEEFPDTKVAKYCRRRLNKLNYAVNEQETEETPIPLDQEQPHPGPIELDPQMMDEEKGFPDTPLDW